MTITSCVRVCVCVGGGLRKPIEICKFAVVSKETGERLLAKHIASVTSFDHVSDACGHARAPHTHERKHTWGTRWLSWWRHCAKSGSLRFFIDLILRPHRGPGVDSASNRNELHWYFLGLTIISSIEKFSEPLAPGTEP
jgi:hypothetical protein